MEHLMIRGDERRGQIMQESQDCFTLPKIAERELSDHKWMNENASMIEEANKRLVACTQVVDPD
jgi:hypothetical protein